MRRQWKPAILHLVTVTQLTTLHAACHVWLHTILTVMQAYRAWAN